MGIYKPVELDTLDEGEVLEDLRGVVSDESRAFAAFVKRFEARAVKAKAKIVLTIEMCANAGSAGEAPESVTYRSRITVKRAELPARSVYGMLQEDEDGPAVFAEAGLATADDPRQRRFATRKGELIDQDTGEVKTR